MTKKATYDWDVLLADYEWVYDNIWFFMDTKEDKHSARNYIMMPWSTPMKGGRHWSHINAIGEMDFLNQIDEQDVIESLAEYMDRKKDPIRRSEAERAADRKREAYEKFEQSGVKQ